MTELNQEQIHQAAQMLSESIPNGWPTVEDALCEIQDRLKPENTLLAVLEKKVVVGWGGILEPTYDGNVFELHPLVVRKDRRKLGIGKRIVFALEDEARRQGGLVIYLGADDEKEGGETSFYNVDLFDDFPQKLKDFKPGNHQSAFYLKMGYKIIGVMPDANGRGKPDIYFGKRL